MYGDLQHLSEGLEGRSKNPVSVLFDALLRPEADFGLDFPSVVRWEHHPEQKIGHVVLGKGPAGGSWQKMETSTLTISQGSWMELPGLTIKEWELLRNR
ncbi:oxidative stress-induced growth inhibitor 2-like [Limulus polyphemus]|uniref:Oxidative stress-induced growth inhibitor 2-like n=1 Tax=Limulus polyphemus TaxID=6850 RepID=A0ABM1RVP8_LIMPO|nr:oxidative stress-induced growth inhibitor 2-like [Limulus polyphemus]